MRIRTPKELGLLVRAARKRRAWSQDELSAEVGVSRTWISEFERGKSTAEVGLVLKALRVLGLSLDVARGEGRRPGTSMFGGPAGRRPARGEVRVAEGSVVDGAESGVVRGVGALQGSGPDLKKQSARTGPAVTIRGRPLGGRTREEL